MIGKLNVFKFMLLELLISAILILTFIMPAFASAVTVDWTRQFGTSGVDYIRSISEDVGGNVYVVGRTDGTLPGQSYSGGQDAFVRKYSADGNKVWTRQFGTSANDNALSISIDTGGNIYVTGRTYGTLPGQSSAGGWDVFVRKYSAAGTELWTRQFGSSGHDHGIGITVVGGNVYVTGYTYGTLPGQSSAGGWDVFVRKYSAAGTELWTRQFGTSGIDQTFNISADAGGNIYIIGHTGGTLPGQSSAGSNDAFVRKYDSAGNEVWTRQFGTSGYDKGRSVFVGVDGNVYVTGYTNGTLTGQSSAGSNDVFVRKYSAAGTELWTRQFGTSGNDKGFGISANTGDNIYVTGSTDGTLLGQSSAGANDAFVRKYSAAGTELWTRQFGSASSDYSFSVSPGIGGIYAAGTTFGVLPGQGSAGGQDAFVVKIVEPSEIATGADTYPKTIAGFLLLLAGLVFMMRGKISELNNVRSSNTQQFN